MSHSRSRQLKLSVWHALSLACLSACATGVQQEFVDDEESSSTKAGSNTGGALMVPSQAGTGSVVPQAGSTSGSGGKASNPFGGSASTGEAGDDTGGRAGGGASTGGAGGGSGSGGAGGSSSGSGGGGGTGSGACGCAKTVAWVDNTNLSFMTGDCMTVGAATYEYVGVKPQTWANKDCNPTAQLAWCSDVGADYKFMVCP